MNIQSTEDSEQPIEQEKIEPSLRGKTKRKKVLLALAITACLTAAAVGAFAYLAKTAPSKPVAAAEKAALPALATATKAAAPEAATNSSSAAVFHSSSSAATKPEQGTQIIVPKAPRKAKILKDDVRALYITSWTAGTKRFNELIDFTAASSLNAVVIDVKDSTGMVGYRSALPQVARYGTYERRMGDINERLAYCRAKGIYTIARIAVFEDPALAKSRPDLAVRHANGGEWRDKKGLAWVDPSSREVWEYNVALAKEASELGFDEIQFDYVRFPTDGKLGSMRYPLYDKAIPKHEVIGKFFRYVDSQLKPLNITVSADLFGLTLEVNDDMNIGQMLEDVADYVDYICPMVYPSHYPAGHMNYKQPGLHPYEVVKNGLARGQERLVGKRAKLRPWLQDFKIAGPYDAGMIKAQIRAAKELGISGYAMWNARNVYTKSAYAN